jgi:hypothetical protein
MVVGSQNTATAELAQKKNRAANNLVVVCQSLWRSATDHACNNQQSSHLYDNPYHVSGSN